jgi:hypothetical protein
VDVYGGGIPILADDWLESKARLFKLIGYQSYGCLCHENPAVPAGAHLAGCDSPTLAFHKSTARWLFVDAPARTSKSYACAPELLHDGLPMVHPVKKVPLDEETIIWACGTDYDTLKEWEYLYGYLSHNDFELVRALGGRVTKDHNSSMQGNLLVVIEWGPSLNGRVAKTIYQGKSAKNEKSLQGEEVKTCGLSEAAEHDRRVVEKHLLVRCNRVIFPTTPKRKALWLYEMSGLKDDVDIERIQFTHECNPHYNYERLEAARQRSVATYGNCEDDDEFMEQFMGEWRMREGRLLPFRWIDDEHRHSHVLREDQVKDYAPWFPFGCDVIVSMDYGYSDKAVALFWALGPAGQLLIFDEVYESYLSHPEFIKRIRDKEAEHGRSARMFIADPQKPELTALMRQAGLPVFSGLSAASMRDRAASGMALVEALSTDAATGEPRLRLHERCERLIQEWKQIRRAEGAADEWSKGSIVGDDHGFDAARYGIMAIRGKRHVAHRENWQERIRAADQRRADRELMRSRRSALVARAI